MSMVALALPFDFEQPAWLWLCLLVPVLVPASLRSLAGLDMGRRVLALVVRSLLIVLVACCLAGIERVQRNDDLTVIFLMDRSHSVEGLESQQEEYIRRAAVDIPRDDRVSLIDFARNAYLQQLPMKGGYFVPPGRLPQMPNTDRTDVASAMRLAMAMFPHDTAKRMVLMSDGNENMGDVLTEARRAKADGIPVDVVPLWYEHGNEVSFDRLIAPAYAEPGEMMPLRMILSTHNPAKGTISIRHNGKPVELGAQESKVELRPGSNTFFIKLPADAGNVQTFEASFRPDDEAMDATALNNTASAFAFVSGKSRALLISNNPPQDAPVLEALRSENVLVDMLSVSELGDFGLLQMLNYATIILANVPAAAFTDQQQEELAVYVKDMGSGLIMTGGDEGFGAGGWIGSPLEEVMPVSFEIKQKRVIPRGALVLIMHSCEVPRGNYWGKEMAKKSVDTISSQDYVGVLAYSYSPGGESWEVPLDLNTNKAAVKARIDRMEIGDMPDFGTTMNLAYAELTTGKAKDAAQKHVIILSDGDASPPPAELLARYKEAKITVSTIAIGWGAHVEQGTMRGVAEATGGEFYNARDPRQLPQIFVKESKVVRRPLIIDEEFPPQVLHSHSELLAGVDPRTALPLLGGMVLTQAKQDPNVIVPLIRMTTDGDKDPLLAHWQYQLGKAVAFTSGYWPVWGDRWTQWPKFAKLWAQIVRWTMRQETPANFDTYTRVEGNRGRIVIDALDKDASYLNFLQLESKVAGPKGRAVPLRFTQTGPGHYEAEIDVEQAGQYLANVQIGDGQGNSLGTIRTGFAVPFSPEYRDLRPNEALLRQVAETTGGRWLEVEPERAEIFSHDLPPAEAKRPAWAWALAWLLLPAFLLDVAVRRLASWLAISVVVEVLILVVLLFGLDLRTGTWWGILGVFALAELVGWTIRFRYIGPMLELMTDTVVALGQVGERSSAALERLKGVRRQVRGGMAGEQTESTTEEPVPLSREMAGRRFDRGESRTGKPAADLGRALGGAEVASPETPKEQPSGPAQEGGKAEEHTTTGRLLRAKRRAKRDQDKEQ